MKTVVISTVQFHKLRENSGAPTAQLHHTDESRDVTGVQDENLTELISV